MTTEEKKDLERKFTQAFLQAIGYPNQANLLDHEVPDFLLIESKLIGIEVTQIFTEPSNGQVQRIRIEGGWDDVLELALKKWHDSGKAKVDVRIMFNDTIHIPKVSKEIIVNEVIALIEKYLPNPGESFWTPDDIMGLPHGIVEFHIHRDKGIESPAWRCHDSAWTSQLTSELVQKSITKKEEERNEYLQSCDKIWLLLVLFGRRPSGSYITHEKVHQEKYRFEFDKVFLFDSLPKKVWELHKM